MSVEVVLADTLSVYYFCVLICARKTEVCAVHAGSAFSVTGLAAPWGIMIVPVVTLAQSSRCRLAHQGLAGVAGCIIATRFTGDVTRLAGVTVEVCVSVCTD